MRHLNSREIKLLLLCVFTIFAVVNMFAGRAVYKALKGSKGKAGELKLELLEQQGWLAEKEYWQQRDQWLMKKMPLAFDSVGKAQGELVQYLQDSLYENRIKIERQTLLEPESTAYYNEVAVTLRIQGEAAKVNDWLSKLQGLDRFQIIKTLKLSLDGKSKEKEPQSICEVTVARWFGKRAEGGN